jgi:fimbrial isopeptide formation D2 family protein
VLVDTLPREVTFVSTDDSSGSYDPGTTLRAPTYTWRYSLLAPGAEKTLHLVANVNSKLDPNTVVSNSVQISSVQTAAVTAGYDVLIRAVSVTPLYLQKALSKGAVGQDKSGRALVDPGSEIVYTLTFSNPATNPTVTQVTITDTLRPELTFVSADGGKLGSYNDATKTYTWVSDSLLPGVQKTLNLTVRVADKLDPNAVISNAATISANTGQVVVTSPQASVNVVVRASPVQAKDISIKPDHIYRGGTNAKSSLMVVVYMPDGIGTGAISNTPMVLTPGNVQATGQIIFGTATQGKILGFFDAGPILSATKGTPQEYGECLVTVTGSLSGGRSFVAQGPIWIISGSGP